MPILIISNVPQQIPYPLSNIPNTSLSYHHGLFFFRFVLFDPLSPTGATLSVGSSTSAWATHHQLYPLRYRSHKLQELLIWSGTSKDPLPSGWNTNWTILCSCCLCVQLPRPVQRAASHGAFPQALALTFFHRVYVMFPES